MTVKGKSSADKRMRPIYLSEPSKSELAGSASCAGHRQYSMLDHSPARPQNE